MVYCPSCGEAVSEENKFCPHCGADLTRQAGAAHRSRIDERKTCFDPPGSGTGFWGAISGGIFLIGLGVLWTLDWWWPGIIILIGLMTILGVTASRRG